MSIFITWWWIFCGVGFSIKSFYRWLSSNTMHANYGGALYVLKDLWKVEAPREVKKKMKFGKLLEQQIEVTVPEWRDKFLSYKQLKKLLRLMRASSALNGSREFGKAEQVFLYILNNDMDNFIAFFLDNEEVFVIRHKELQQRIQGVVDVWGPNGSQPSETYYKDKMTKIGKEMVDFHGEMVHLVNYSNINYTGLAKILKKYDKVTRSVRRLPFIQKLREHPFLSTDLISNLVKECESKIDELFLIDEEVEIANDVIVLDGETIFKNTVEALLKREENGALLENDEAVESGSGVSRPEDHHS